MKKPHLETISRRKFIHLTGAGLGAVYLGGCASLFRSKQNSNSLMGEMDSTFNTFSPIDRTLGEIGPRVFSGDIPEKAHSIFWNKEEFIKTQGGVLPSPSESRDVTVIGGGIAGLCSAYFLRDFKPLILEQAARMGGNSRGESWRSIDYPIGAVYLSLVKDGSPISELFRELGITDKIAHHLEEEPVVIDGKTFLNCWDTGTTEQNRAQFQRLRKYFLDVNQETNGQWFPRIPMISHPSDPNVNKANRSKLNKLDSVSFYSHLKKIAGEPLHPHLETLIEHYCWSTYGGTSREISAASGLAFFAGDFDGISVCSGGNATIAEALLRKLYQELGSASLRTSSTVFDVKVVSDGVRVTYVDAENRLKTVHSKTVIASCPKFVLAHMIHDLEPQRLQAISQLEYRSYLVANVLVSKKVSSSFYDLQFFNSTNSTPKFRDSVEAQGATDVIQRGSSENTVLSLYRGFPYSGARGELYAKTAYERYRREFEEQIRKTILPIFHLENKDIHDIRITRWGHPMPLAAVGNIASGRIDWLRKPFKNRIFFAEQDNWTLPCFETCFEEALVGAEMIRERLSVARR